MFQSSELNTLIGWLAGFPPEQVRLRPRLNMLYAWALLAVSRFPEVAPRLEEIEQALGVTVEEGLKNPELPALVRGGLGEVACLRANMTFHQFDLPRVLALCQQSLQYLGEDVTQCLLQSRRSLLSVLSFNMGLAYEFSGETQAASEAFLKTIILSQEDENAHLILFASSHLAQILTGQGQLHQAAQTYHQALQFVKKISNIPSPISGVVHIGLGNILYEWNDLENAASHLNQGVNLARIWANLEALIPGTMGLARIHVVQGNLSEAFRLLDETENLAQQLHSEWTSVVLAALRANLWVQTGNREAASRWAQNVSLGPQDDIPVPREGEVLYLIRVLIGLGKFDEALNLVGRMIAPVEASQRYGILIELLVLKALALHGKGETVSALEALTRAIQLAEPEGYVRIFIDEGAPVAQLLEKAARAGQYPEYVNRLLAASGALGKVKAGKAMAPALLRADRPSAWHEEAEHLSERELDVLRLMADGLTNQQIADRLFVSLNT
ncbi:MAG TPA: tetratricopeptide repeat protein, partial [Anaerolineales bacterium]